jgi:hypothetical protein
MSIIPGSVRFTVVENKLNELNWIIIEQARWAFSHGFPDVQERGQPNSLVSRV